MIFDPPYNDPVTFESLLNILEGLAEREFFKNNVKLAVFSSSLDSRLLRVFGFMNNLEELDSSKCDLTFEHLANIFHSCPKIVKLHVKLFQFKQLNKERDLKIYLRPRFQQLLYLRINGCIENDSWPVLQEIIT